MNFFEKRRHGKWIKHLLHEARHARHMREDVAPAADLERLDAAAADLRAAWRDGAADRLEALGEKVVACAQRVYPPKPHPHWREWVEIVIVAGAVAMGIRTYFLQPFKIPTGSMQPTLYGITVAPQAQREWYDQFPVNVLNWCLTGDWYEEIRARTSGAVELRQGRDEIVCYVDGIPHRFKRAFLTSGRLFVHSGDYVRQGELIAGGRVRAGDHIFVNMLKYNFMPPQRGDVIVFRTAHVQYPGIDIGDHYIKRLVGLPDERIGLQRYSDAAPLVGTPDGRGGMIYKERCCLVVDGKRITEPFPFHRLLTDTNYNGYVFAGQLSDADHTIQVEPGHFLPFGDNTMNSEDGRYFGGVQMSDLLGPACWIFWPFTSRWGVIR